MAQTLTTDLIIPEVLAPMINEKLTDNMVFFPIVSFDDTLVGRPGDTITFPSYSYIGDADDTNENGLVTPVALTASDVDKKVKKTTKAVTLTDESMLSAYGNPIDEASSQIALAIDSKADNDILAELKTVGATRQYAFQDAFSVDHVADAMSIFGEDELGAKALFINAADKAILRKSDDYIKASDIGQDLILRGAVAELFGSQIIVSNKIVNDATNGETWRFIVKPGAIKLIRKRSVMLEVEREANYMRSTIYGSYHYVAYLYNEDLMVAMRQFTAAKAVTNITSTAGEAENGTLLVIPTAAPVGYKWVYKLGSSDVTFTFGTALSGYTDWVSSTTEIAASTSTKAAVALVDSADKPVKYQNVTLVKGTA
jgi:hypothetical protein